MSEDFGSPADAAPATIDPLPPADTQEPLSLEDAVSRFAKRRENPTAESADPATAAESPPQGDDGDQPQADPAEAQTQEAEPAEQPPIEPPRSWTKEEKEAFAKWPREAQESIARVASTREAEFRRSQNEAAEAKKAIEAKLAEVSTERERYLKAAASDIESKEADIAARFPHIKSMADVNFLAQEAVRLANTGTHEDLVQSQQVQAYLQAWRTAQDDLAVTKQAKTQAEQQHTTEKQTKWAEFVNNESKAFSETLSADDKGKLKGWLDAAPGFLEAKGFTKEELNALASGQEKLAIHDRRMQSLILDGLKYRDLQNAKVEAAKKPVPPVQRPGAAPPRGAAATQNIQALSQRLSASGSIEDALALRMARRATSK
jgi:hypothetical protein